MVDSLGALGGVVHGRSTRLGPKVALLLARAVDGLHRRPRVARDPGTDERQVLGRHPLALADLPPNRVTLCVFLKAQAHPGDHVPPFGTLQIGRPPHRPHIARGQLVALLNVHVQHLEPHGGCGGLIRLAARKQ